MYNIENLLAAFALIADDVDVKYMREVATTFKGVEHRNEFVRNYRDVEYYNNSIASSPTVDVHIVNTLEEAVNKAVEISVIGDIVTLAPACTSFDMFENFEVRGNKFKEVVKNLK